MKQQILSETDVNNILQALQDLPDKTAYDVAILAVRTGLRTAEISGLAWTSVNFDRSELTIVRGHARTIPIPDPVKTALRRRRLEDVSGDLVFGHNYPCLVAWVNRALRRACRKLNLPTVTTATLRQTYASRLIATVPPAVAARILGCGRIALSHF